MLSSICSKRVLSNAVMGGHRVTSSVLSGNSLNVVSSSKRSYHDNIVEHYENPRNVGALDKNDSHVGTVSISQTNKQTNKKTNNYPVNTLFVLY